MVVHSERGCAQAGFVPPRPFRVNAGPVHSYVLMADGGAKYLSELKAGHRVMGCRVDGSTRVLVLGRAKVEPRPTVLVHFSEGAGADIR